MGNAVMTPTGPILIEHFLEEADLQHEQDMKNLKNPPVPPPVGGPNAPPAPATPSDGGSSAPPQPGKDAGGADAGGKPVPKAVAAKLEKAAKHTVLKPHDRNRPVTQGGNRILKRAIGRFLKRSSRQVADQLLAELGKADGDNPPMSEAEAEAAALAAVDALDLQGWVALSDDLLPVLERVYADGLVQSLRGVGVEVTDEMFDQANAAAVDYAAGRAAELVGTKTEQTDALLLQATRDKLKPIIVQGLTEGWSRSKLADAIMDSTAFDPARATLIAQTEVALADGRGAVDGWQKSGAVDGKQWLLSADHDHDDECNDNADDGVIPVDQAFSSGDLSEPAHPGCLCVVAPVVNNDESE
jgi:hypothetical protein